MEECEALCDKLAIMINGQLQCLGTIYNLKKRYGDGYRLILKCKHSEQTEQVVSNLDSFIRAHFPTAILEDRQYETLFYTIKTNNEIANEQTLNLSRIFALIEENKLMLKIESYSLSQTTLEQIFMSFANHASMLSTSQQNINNSNLNNNYSSSYLKQKPDTNLLRVKNSFRNFGYLRKVFKTEPDEIFALSYKKLDHKAHEYYF